MGSADLVPGVSGGTVALIMGVYEDLIQSIKHVSTTTLKLGLTGKIIAAFKSVPFSFLLPLGLGIVTAILSLAQTFEYLLINQPIYLWSFFFGLVAMSVYVVGLRVSKWENQARVMFILGAIFAYVIVGLLPVETPATLPAFFVAGAIAICAMILPGISGSFLLLIMGKYAQVLSALNDRNFVILGVFLFGAVFGLAAFSRLLSYLFANYHNIMMAFLTGVLLGSLRKVWPWKEVMQTYTDSHGVVMPLVEQNIIPSQFDLTVVLGITLMIVGAGLIYFLSRYDQHK